MSQSLFKSVLLTIIFPFLTACAVKYMFQHLLATGLDLRINAYCENPPTGPESWLLTKKFLIPYTGLSHIDDKQGICGLIVFFHALMDSPAHIPFIQYFVGVGAPYALFTMLEAHRKEQSRILSYPTLWLLLTQFVSYGATYPIYCLLLVITGGVTKARKYNAASFSQAQAESFIFGMLIGGAIPSFAMFVVDDPFITWIWQLFPAIISFTQTVYLQFRQPANPRSGYSTMRVLYISVFLIAACTHIAILLPYKDDLQGLIKYFIPSTTLLSPSSSIDLLVLHFLKWDFALGFTAFALTMFWFVQDVQELVAILLWYLVAIPFLGMGAAVLGVAMWRDGVLWDNRGRIAL